MFLEETAIQKLKNTEHCVLNYDIDSNPQITIAACIHSSVHTWWVITHASLSSHPPRNWNQMDFQGFPEGRLSAVWDCPWIQLFMRLQWIVWMKIPWFGQSVLPSSASHNMFQHKAEMVHFPDEDGHICFWLYSAFNLHTRSLRSIWTNH